MEENMKKKWQNFWLITKKVQKTQTEKLQEK